VKLPICPRRCRHLLTGGRLYTGWLPWS